MSLYGDSNTVKGYAFVSLEDKTVVGTGLLDVAKSDAKALNSALENYIDALKEKGVASDVNKDDVIVDENEIEGSDNNVTENPDNNTDKPDTNTGKNANSVTGEVTDIKSSVNDGNTVYYLQVDGKYYYIKVTDAMEVLLISKGDTVTVEFEKSGDTFIPATSVTVK